MVVNTLKAARKRTGKIRSNLHTGQYAGSISPGHSQGQTLVEPLALPRVARHINKFLRKTTHKRVNGLPIHNSGLNCHWLKVVIALEVLIFLAFCNLQLLWPQNQPVWQSLYYGPEQKCPRLLRPTPCSGLCTRGPKSGHPASLDQCGSMTS